MYPSTKYPNIGMAVKDFIDAQFESYGDELVLVYKSMITKTYLTKIYKYLSLTLLTIKALATNEIKIIHTHYLGVNFAILWLINIVVNKKFIVTVHGSDLNSVKSLMLKKVIQLMLRRTDAIVCVGTDLAMQIEELGIAKRKIYVINIGIQFKQVT